MLVRDYKSASTAIRRKVGFNFVKREPLILAGALLMAALLKLALVLAGSIPFNSDEAVVALMARHILQGARPVFYYGQAYMSSLDAWLVAIGYRLIGEGVLAVRAVQTILYLAYILSIWLLARTLFADRRIPLLAAIIAAVPTVLVTTYTTASLGGYGEILVMGNLILWLGYQLTWGRWRYSWVAWLAFGLLSGIAFWTLGMSLVYLLPVGVMILYRFQPRQILLMSLCLVGFLVGSSPWWGYNLSHDWAGLRMLLESQPGQTSVSEHLVSLLVVGLPAVLGLRYPWSVELSPLPVIILGVLIYLSAGIFLVKRLKADRGLLTPGAALLLGLYALSFLLIFLLTRFGIDATGRYLLPLNLLVVLLLALLIEEAWQRKPALGAMLLILVLAINAFETWRAARLPDLITTQVDPITRFDNRYDADLISFLSKQNEKRGYSNYWVSFRLAFLSQEELIYAAELPYKADLSLAPGDNRYPPYAQAADESQRVAYVTSLHPGLDALLRTRLSSLGVSYDEQQIGPYHVFFNLSQAVAPAEIGLEAAAPRSE